MYRQYEEARVPEGRERGVTLQRVESQWGRQAGTCVRKKVCGQWGMGCEQREGSVRRPAWKISGRVTCTRVEGV